jgi:hypothetical protein
LEGSVVDAVVLEMMVHWVGMITGVCLNPEAFACVSAQSL